jgi:putative membrane protein
MKITSLVTAAVLCALGGAAMAQSTTQPAQPTQRTTGSADQGSAMDHDRMSRSDKDGKLTSESFAKKAAAAGAAEVEMGKLGVQKATSPEVKKYAQQLVDDHTKGNKELMTAAKGKTEDLPKSPDLMHKAMMEKFEHQKADKEFDHDFMAQMVKDHQKVIELYEQASTDPGVDPQLQAVAKKSLPTLREHLKEAQSMEKQLTAND